MLVFLRHTTAAAVTVTLVAGALFAAICGVQPSRNGSLPRLLALLGYVTGALLLLTPPLPHRAQSLLPLRVMAISVHPMLHARSAE